MPDFASRHPPAIQARGWVVQASHLRRSEDLAGAEAAYATALRLAPDDGYVLARSCLLDLQRGRLAEARSAAQHAVTRTSGEDRAVAVANRGQVRLLSGDHSGAVADFCAAIKDGEPGWPVVTASVINLAFALSLAGPIGAAHALDVVRSARRELRGKAHRTLLRNRLAWIDALAWYALDPTHANRAARKLRRVIARARELGASTDAALAALDHHEITGRPLAAHADEIIDDMPADTDREAVATLHKLRDQARDGAALAQLTELREPLARFARRRLK